MKKVLLTVIYAIVLYAPCESPAQSRSVTLGKEFYVAFGENTETTDVYLKLKVVTLTPTTVNVYYGDNTSPAITRTIAGSGAYDIILDKDLIYPDVFATTENKAVRITSTAEIALYALSQGYASAEATAILPVQSLSSSYSAISYQSMSSLLSVVSINDGTNVTGGFNGSLNRGWTGLRYGTIATSLSVDADNPIAVFVSSKETKIPSGVGDADNLFEQIWPFHSWGKSYIVPVTHRNRDKVRILVKETGTNITVTGGFVGTLPALTSLNAGDIVEFDISAAVQIESDKPVAVNSFMIGNKDTNLVSSNKDGDPSQCWINPNEQMTAYTMIAPFYMTTVESQIETHFMIIVTRDKYKNYTTLKRNGSNVSLYFTNPPGIPDYAVAVVSMYNNNSNVYEVENVYGFNAYVYGYGTTESYYFAAGSMVWDLNAYFTVDTIHHLATSPITNSYPTSGSASIFRNIEYPYTCVEWLINGEDVSSLINDPATGVEYNFVLPTDTAELSGYNLEIGENLIVMRVCRSGCTDCVDYPGKIWILPPPDPEPDCGFVYGNPGGGGGGGGSVTIDIKDNDSNIKPGDKLVITGQPKHGTVTVRTSDTAFIYTPGTDFKGIDTITYCVTSEQFNEEVCTEVYVVVVFPAVDRYEACPNTQLFIGLEPTPGVIFDWYDGSTLIKSASDTVLVTSGAGDKTFHAVPRLASTGNAIGSIKIPVTVYAKTTGCGATTDEMCDGSILFSEDFSGNDITDDNFSATPLSGKYKMPYAFIQTEPNTADNGKYALAKTYSATIDDHTYPADTDKGRMLLVGGTNAADTILQISLGSLCSGMTYSFSAWIRNLSPSSTLIPTVGFLLTDTVKNEVKYSSSANITAGTWGQYGFQYSPTANLSNLKLVIVNYPAGTGSGNLYAVDDIKIALCVPEATVILSDDTVCTKESVSFSGIFSDPYYSLGGSPVYRWQFSPDNENWSIVSGATSNYYTVNNAKTGNSGYYRMVTGTSSSIGGYGISSPNCVVYSEPVHLHVEPCFSLTDDYSSTFRTVPVTVGVLDNDVFPCDNPTLGISGTTANGNAVFSGNQIIYTPVGDFTGIDTVKYSVDCDGTTREAYLYVVVAGTEEPSYSACPGVVIKLSMIPIADVTYDWYTSYYETAPVQGGASSDFINVTVPSYAAIYYIQPYYKGIAVGDRIPVTVSVLSSCGSSNNAACEGTLIFKEDFGGNNVSDPVTGAAIAAPASTDFTYNSTGNISDGQYSVLKYRSYDYYNNLNEIIDHTHENNSERGYFMFADANNSALTYYERTVDLELCFDVELSVNAWFKNVAVYGQEPNVRFVITDNLGDTLTNYQTGSITGSDWKQYGVKLNIPQSTTQIKLSLSNAVIASNTGNDIAIDDIDVRICSDAAISIPAVSGICSGSDYTFSATYASAKLESLYGAGNVVLKWQHSVTGNINNPSDWTDIPDATSPSYGIIEANATHNGYYRLLAGDAATIDKPGCRIASNPVEAEILSLPVPAITGNSITCSDESASLTVSGGASYYWYHNGSTSSTITYTPTTNTELIVRVTGSNGCSINDTVNIEYVAALALTKSNDTVICTGQTVQLNASSEGADISYLWSTGATSDAVTVTPTASQYYYIEVSNPKNCVTKDSIYVDVIELPVVEINGENDICLNDGVKLTASGAVTYEWNTGETSADILVSPQVPTAYSVIGKNEHGCPATANHQIATVRPLPTPLIAGKSEICYGENTVLTASGGAAYEWKHDLSTSDEIVVNPATETTYTVTVTGNNGCSADTSITVSVNGLPAFDTKTDTIICAGNSIVLQTSGDDADGFTYLWSTGETTAAVTVAPTVSQYYYIEVATPKNCVSKDSIYVDVIELPVVAIDGENDICLNDGVKLTASGAVTYEWNTGETSEDITVSPQVPTAYTVIGKNEHGCPATANHQIATVRPLPTPLIAGKSEICYGENIVLTASGGAVYEWKHNLSTSNEIAVSPATETTYTVTVTGNNGCSADTSRTVKVNSLPAMVISADTGICTGKSVTLTAQSEQTVNYNWSTGAQTSSVTVDPTTSQTYYIEAVDSKHCVTRDSIYVEVYSLPNLAIIGKDEICAGDSVKLTVAGANTYKWSTGETGDSILVSPEWATAYQVIGVDEHGCQAATGFEITNIKPKPTPDISGKSEICHGESAVLKASGGNTYRWAHNSSPIDSITVEPTTDSTFTVTVTGINGCSADKSITVKVNGLPVVAPSADTIICTGQSVVLQAHASGMGLTYLWSNEERSSVIELHPAESQSVWVEVTNPKKCSVRKEIAVEVLPPPVLKIIGPEEICAGSELTLTVFGAANYVWNTGFEGNIYTVKPESNSLYQVTGTDEYGCKSVATAEISILDKPKVAINVDPKIISEKQSEVRFETVTDMEDYEVIWDFGDGSWSTSPSTSHYYHIEGRDSLYNVVFSIVDTNGCADTIREVIYVDLFIPTLFFPNAGQIFMKNCELCQKLEIFDRLGLKMYEGPAGWDGIYNGRIVDPDTYFYVITLNFNILGNNVRKGFITVGRTRN